MRKKDEVSTTEILAFLKDHMVMKEDFDISRQELKQEIKDARQEFGEKLSKQKHELMHFVEERLSERLGELKNELIDKLVDKKTFGKLVMVLEKKEVLNKKDVKTIMPVLLPS